MVEQLTIILAIIIFAIGIGTIAVWRRIPLVMFIMGALIAFLALQTTSIVTGYTNNLDTNSTSTQTTETISIPTATTRYQMGHSFSDSNDGNSLIGINNPTFTEFNGSDPIELQELDTYVEFNGSTQYAQAVGNTVLDITTQDFSFMGVLYRDTDSGTAETIITKKGAGASGYNLQINGSDNLQFTIKDSVAVSNLSVILSSTTVQVDKWYVWGITADRNGLLFIFLFDISTETLYVISADISAQSNSLTTTQQVTIARDSGSSSSFCDCWMDEVRYYDSIVLTGQEFHDIIHHGFPDVNETTITTVITESEIETAVPIEEPLEVWTQIFLMLIGSMFMIAGALIWKERENTPPQ